MGKASLRRVVSSFADFFIPHVPVGAGARPPAFEPPPYWRGPAVLGLEVPRDVAEALQKRLPLRARTADYRGRTFLEVETEAEEVGTGLLLLDSALEELGLRATVSVIPPSLRYEGVLCDCREGQCYVESVPLEPGWRGLELVRALKLGRATPASVRRAPPPAECIGALVVAEVFVDVGWRRWLFDLDVFC